MTLQECYDQMGGSYTDVIRRLSSEERVTKLLGMLLKDNTMGSLRTALADANYENAFIAAHSLKGILLNLGLTRFASVAAQLTDELRAQLPNEKIEPLMADAEQCYEVMCKSITCLLESQA